MRNRFVLLLVVLLMLATLAGCGGNGGSRVKSEEDILEDLTTASDFYMVEGSVISDFSIIKRLTDEEMKIDKVYVSITIDHKAATAQRAYVMDYTCYNDGWRLDSFEAYYGDDAQWETVPKAPPTNEQIMEMLIAESNAQINLDYEEADDRYIRSKSLFFEEGTYSTYIYSGDLYVDPETEYAEYNCIVSTTRVFDYMLVKESQILYFCFDFYNYRWYLSCDEVIDYNCYPYVSGEWQLPGGSVLEIGYSYNDYDVLNSDEIVSIFWSNGASTNTMAPSANIRNWLSSDCDYADHLIEVARDGLWRHFYNPLFGTTDLTQLVPVSLNESVPTLESPGIVDMKSAKEAEHYREIAKKALGSIYSDDNSVLEEMWLPGYEPELLSEILESDRQGFAMTHLLSMAVTEEEFESDWGIAYRTEMEKCGYAPEGMFWCRYYMSFEEDDGCYRTVLFADVGGDTYIIDVY